MRAALYIRVSTEDQTEYSPAAQKGALLSYAQKKRIYRFTKSHLCRRRHLREKSAVSPSIYAYDKRCQDAKAFRYNSRAQA